MSQVVSRAKRRDEDSEIGARSQWKKPFLIVFHAVSASTYGYAICWQSVSATSAQLYARTNPFMRVFGRWRFLTYQCLVMQFVAYSLCLASHFEPRLRRQKDFFFTTFAFPVGLLVFSSFWTIWFVAGREYILPASMDTFYPPWLNHVTHTILAPINLVELLSSKHRYLSDRTSLLSLTGYIVSYTSYLLYIRFQTGRFVYPFLNQMDAVPVGAYIVGTAVYAICVYKSGKLLHDFYHGVKSFRRSLFGSGGEGVKKSN